MKPENFCTLSILGLLLCFQATASDLYIAVASNFSNTLNELSKAYTASTGHTIKSSSASTGKLYAQIKNGAPTDILLAADIQHPQLLIEENFGLYNNLHHYAQGQLVLINRIKNYNKSCQSNLSKSEVKYIALANPAIAPYGLAAQQALQSLGQWNINRHKIILSENITQTLHFFHSANAQVSLIAKSQLYNYTMPQNSCTWEIPLTHYQAIKQTMLILKKSANKPQVTAFIKFMKSKQAIHIIKKHGYLVTS